MNSNGYKRFKSRLDYFLTDIETSEVLIKNKELLKGNPFIFKKINTTQQPLLSSRTNNANSRRLVLEHLRKTVYVSFIKEMYEEVSEYLRYILREGALNGANTNRLIGNNQVNLPANLILSQKSHKDIIQLIMDQIFQQIEQEKDIKSLIPKINNKLDLKIDKTLINNALPFLEIRHIFIHADGKPNTDFIQQHSQITLDSHHRINLTSSLIRTAYEHVNKLIREIDNQMIAHKYFSKTELHHPIPKQ